MVIEEEEIEEKQFVQIRKENKKKVKLRLKCVI